MHKDQNDVSETQLCLMAMRKETKSTRYDETDDTDAHNCTENPILEVPWKTLYHRGRFI